MFIQNKQKYTIACHSENCNKISKGKLNEARGTAFFETGKGAVQPFMILY